VANVDVSFRIHHWLHDTAADALHRLPVPPTNTPTDMPTDTLTNPTTNHVCVTNNGTSAKPSPSVSVLDRTTHTIATTVMPVSVAEADPCED
jgi:hypothetical protein